MFYESTREAFVRWISRVLSIQIVDDKYCVALDNTRHRNLPVVIFPHDEHIHIVVAISFGVHTSIDHKICVQKANGYVRERLSAIVMEVIFPVPVLCKGVHEQQNVLVASKEPTSTNQ